MNFITDPPLATYGFGLGRQQLLAPTTVRWKPGDESLQKLKSNSAGMRRTVHYDEGGGFLMRLSRPLYEGLPLFYGALGGCALYLAYVEGSAMTGKIAFVIGFCTEIAALTLFLRRLGTRELNREYSGAGMEFPAAKREP